MCWCSLTRRTLGTITGICTTRCTTSRSARSMPWRFLFFFSCSSSSFETQPPCTPPPFPQDDGLTAREGNNHTRVLLWSSFAASVADMVRVGCLSPSRGGGKFQEKEPPQTPTQGASKFLAPWMPWGVVSPPDSVGSCFCASRVTHTKRRFPSWQFAARQSAAQWELAGAPFFFLALFFFWFLCVCMHWNACTSFSFLSPVARTRRFRDFVMAASPGMPPWPPGVAQRELLCQVFPLPPPPHFPAIRRDHFVFAPSCRGEGP